MPVPPNFLMSGGDSPFRPAGPCPVTNGPHNGSTDQGSYLVADAATRDRTASARIALWRCAECGSLLIGIGNASMPLGDGVSGWAQEFTWLEQVPARYQNLELVQAAFNRRT
jgi:hypothetical protein